MTRFIICKNCRRRLKLNNDNVPNKCPLCEHNFRTIHNTSLISAMLQAITGEKTENEYYECDAFGFIKNEKFKWQKDEYDNLIL